MLTLEPGIHEVISDVKIRRGPEIVEYKDRATEKIISNEEGKYSVGTHIKILSVLVAKDNTLWGRISEPNAAGIALYVCMKNINREFVKRISALPQNESTETRLSNLEAWARSKGYTG